MNIDKQYDSHAYYEAVDEIKRLSAENKRYRDYLDGIAIGLEAMGGWDASVEGIRRLLATVSTEQTDVCPETAIEKDSTQNGYKDTQI